MLPENAVEIRFAITRTSSKPVVRSSRKASEGTLGSSHESTLRDAYQVRQRVRESRVLQAWSLPAGL
jgi:hypothetical protein